MTKSEQEFVKLANEWLAANITNDQVRTVVWNGISEMCRAISNERHDEIAAFAYNTAANDGF